MKKYVIGMLIIVGILGWVTVWIKGEPKKQTPTTETKQPDKPAVTPKEPEKDLVKDFIKNLEEDEKEEKEYLEKIQTIADRKDLDQTGKNAHIWNIKLERADKKIESLKKQAREKIQSNADIYGIIAKIDVHDKRITDYELLTYLSWLYHQSQDDQFLQKQQIERLEILIKYLVSLLETIQDGKVGDKIKELGKATLDILEIDNRQIDDLEKRVGIIEVSINNIKGQNIPRVVQPPPQQLGQNDELVKIRELLEKIAKSQKEIERSQQDQEYYDALQWTETLRKKGVIK
ncbi:MAG: hypothetical protein HY762_09220 [Planctomycetes bacterium]|nr:hypothetical protein [Planctomycetota bacterium]